MVLEPKIDWSRVPDVHCHLEALLEPARAIEAAMLQGVGPIVAVGMQAASSARSLELRRRFPDSVLAAVGLHPSEIAALDDAALQRELEYVRTTLPQADALGEVGLDYKDATQELQRDRQRQALRAQLEWAAVLRKPVNVHCRRAERDIVGVGADFHAQSGLGVVLHWFTHSEKLARACAEAGLFISCGPSILHDPAQARVAAVIHPDLLLVETDSPVVYANRQAEPAWAMQVALQLGMLRGESLSEIAARLQRNLNRWLRGEPQAP